MKNPHLARLAMCFAMLSLASAAGSYYCYARDAALLRVKASQLTAGIADPAERVLALLNWVHNETGTAKNEQGYFLPQLGATPCQVLEAGGDCADKSRLLSAMLRQIGLPATMAMCLHPETGRPTHTIVEAQIGPGRFMVVDPAFDLAFPKPGSDGYYGLIDLRRDPSILTARLDQRADTLAPGDPLRSYNRSGAVYARATTVNWNKNFVTRLVRDSLAGRLGENLYRLPRPPLLEEPQLAVASAGVLAGTVFGFAAMWFGRRDRTKRRGPAHKPASSAIIAQARHSLGVGHPDA